MLVWVPAGLLIAAAVLVVALGVLANSDPVGNAAAGYGALFVVMSMVVVVPVLLGAFVPGCVMLSRSNRARALMEATSHRPRA